MNLTAVGVLAMVLAIPAVLGLAEGSIDPDEVGLRVLLAVAVAVVAEVVLRRFVDALRGPVDPPTLVEVGSGGPAGLHGDPPAA